MDSTITLYKVDFTPAKNAYVDHFQEYLGSITKTRVIEHFQYIKHGLDIEIRIEGNQYTISNISDTYQFPYNYVAIKNNTFNRPPIRQGAARTYYYFIMGLEWLSEKTIGLKLSLDTINTFQDKLIFDPRTKIIRQHKDRFIHIDDNTVTNLIRYVDPVDEGISGVVKKRTYRTFFQDYDTGLAGNKWYLIYNTDKPITNSNNNVPITCYMVGEPSFNKTMICDSGEQTLTFQDIRMLTYNGDSNYIAFLSEENEGGEIIIDNKAYKMVPGTSFLISAQKDLDIISLSQIRESDSQSAAIATTNKKSIIIRNTPKGRRFTSEELDPSDYLGTNGWLSAARTKGTIYRPYSGIVDNINNIDRSLTTLVKIIEIPYFPTYVSKIDRNTYSIGQDWGFDNEVPIGINGTNITALRLRNLNATFYRSIRLADNFNDMEVSIESLENRYNTLRNDEYESKLYNSAFHTMKFYYDSFSDEIKYENIIPKSGDVIPKFRIGFQPSNSLNSNILFKIEEAPQTCSIKSETDFDHYILSNRNNELPLFNSDYINYLRNGYNYDMKVKNTNLAKSITSTVLSVVGATAGLILAPATGGISAVAATAAGVGAISSIANIISNDINAQNRINQNLDEKAAQAASVEGSNDLNLFNTYSGNQLYQADYSVYGNVKDAIADLFFYCGYAQNSQGIPDTQSRRCFNYVQCDANFGEKENDVEWAEYIDDVKARYQAGVTYYHQFEADYYDYQNLRWDFNQKLENWEDWICSKGNV